MAPHEVEQADYATPYRPLLDVKCSGVHLVILEYFCSYFDESNSKVIQE